MIDVSVIIVNYNTLKMTQECIDSVFDKTQDVSFEIILVDNASKDGSKEHFEKEHRIKYIYSEENLGFGRANNLGYEQSQGKYIFLLNSDTLLLNNAIYMFYQYMENAPSNVGCLGASLLDENHKHIHSGDVFPGYLVFFKRVIHFTFYELFSRTMSEESCYSHDTDIDYITGADLFMRRELVEKYGMFDPDFFMYFEETEMQYRYAKHGYIRRIILGPEIIHLVGGSFKKKSHSLVRVIREMKGRYIFLKKVYSPLKQHLISCMHLLMIPRIIVCRSTSNEKKELIMLILKNL